MKETIAELRQAWGYADGSLLHCVENNYIYKYDATSTESDDGDTVIRPVMTGAGRWLKLKEYVEANL